MERIRTWLFTVISLIAGALIGFFYAQVETGKLRDQASSHSTQLSDKVSGLEAQLAEAMQKTESTLSEIATLKTDVDEKSKLIEDQKAKIMELEAASQAAQPQPRQ